MTAAQLGLPKSFKKCRTSPVVAILILKTPENVLHVVSMSAKGSRDAESMKRRAWWDGWRMARWMLGMKEFGLLAQATIAFGTTQSRDGACHNNAKPALTVQPYNQYLLSLPPYDSPDNVAAEKVISRA